MLTREGVIVNHKRFRRLCREEKLQVGAGPTRLPGALFASTDIGKLYDSSLEKYICAAPCFRKGLRVFGKNENAKVQRGETDKDAKILTEWLNPVASKRVDAKREDATMIVQKIVLSSVRTAAPAPTARPHRRPLWPWGSSAGSLVTSAGSRVTTETTEPMPLGSQLGVNCRQAVVEQERRYRREYD
jgi:hypothetical protein